MVGRYTAVTDVCGKSYRNCSLCDDESKYHPQGACGFHYSPAGWRLLSKQTVDYIEKAMGVVSSASKAAGTTMMKSDDDEQVCHEQQYLEYGAPNYSQQYVEHRHYSSTTKTGPRQQQRVTGCWVGARALMFFK